MKEKIVKLGNLNNPESFIQINTIKGFKYVDKAGEIVNYFHKENIPPVFEMNLNGLTIEKPFTKSSVLKVTPNSIWMKFSEANNSSLDAMLSVFEKESNEVIKILEIEKVNRVGWRNYFIYDFSSKKEKDKYFNKLINIENKGLSAIQIEIEKGVLRIQPVEKKDGGYGVLFDVDIFEKKEMEFSEAISFLKNIKKYFSDKEGFLKILNSTFQK